MVSCYPLDECVPLQWAFPLSLGPPKALLEKHQSSSLPTIASNITKRCLLVHSNTLTQHRGFEKLPAKCKHTMSKHKLQDRAMLACMMNVAVLFISPGGTGQQMDPSEPKQNETTCESGYRSDTICVDFPCGRWGNVICVQDLPSPIFLALNRSLE